MQNIHIEIVCSSVIELSSMSLESRRAILKVLRRHYSDVGITIVNNLADLESLINSKPDFVFLGMKYVPSDASLGVNDPNKIWLSEYLEEHGIAYSGSSFLAHELELNKPEAKQRVRDAGLDTSSYYVSRLNTTPEEADIVLTYPLFIKPSNRGGGYGIDRYSVVNNFKQLVSKTASVSKDQKSDSLVEEYLCGREFSVAILKDETTDSFHVMPLELVAPQDRQGKSYLSGTIKHANTEKFFPVVDGELRVSISSLALNVFHALDARDYGRIDIRLNASGAPQFLEANLIPSLIAGYGNFPKACMMNLGLKYEEMILRIVRLGLTRRPLIEQIGLTPSTSLV